MRHTPANGSPVYSDIAKVTLPGHELFAIAGVVRGDAWAMLTQPPGPDIAPFHDRQVVVLAPDQWRAWLSGEPNEAELLRPIPAGTLAVERVPDPQD